MSVPEALGELPIVLWLLMKGVKEPLADTGPTG
jgi:hypothetical protein